MNRAKTVLIGLAVIFVSAGIAQASTTIGTNITTGGALSVSSQASLGQATSTMFSAYSAYFGGSATSTFDAAGNLAVIGTLGVTGVSTFTNASTTQSASIAGPLWVGGNATTSANGNIATKGTLGVAGATSLASTTAASFQTGLSGTHFSQITAGYCNTDGTVAAVATKYGNLIATTTVTIMDCVPITAVTFTANSGVFVQATSSLPAYLYVQSASTTPATGHISIGIANTSTSTPSSGSFALNFWAFQ